MGDYWSSAPLRRLRHPVESSPVWSLLGTVAWCAVALVVGAPFLLALSVVLPLLALLQWLRRPRGAHVIGAMDRRWLGSRWQCSVMHAVIVLETQLDINNIRNLVATKLIPLYPRLLMIARGNYWQPDAAFSLSRHVFPATCDESQLQHYVTGLLAEGLSRDRPAWELRVLTRHAVLRVHQSVAEGRQIVRVLCQALADGRVTPEPMPSALLLLQIFGAFALGPLTLLCWLFITTADCNVFTRKHVWTGRSDMAWSARVPLAHVTHVKLVTRCSTNCVLLAALAGALRNLMQGCGVVQPPDVHIVVPASIGRWSAPVLLTLPVSVEGAVPRLWKMRRSLESLRRSARPAIMYLAALALLAAGPGNDILTTVVGKASLQFSSVRGPANNIKVDGSRVLGIYPLLAAPPGVGVSVTAMTYGDRLYIAASTDSSLEPAASLLLHHLAAQVEQLHQTLLHRRIPGESRAHILLRRADVTASPTRELRLRLSCVQEEVTHQLCDGLESDRVSTLKLEFSQLLSELRRRKSLLGDSDAVFEDEEMDGAMWRPQRRRALSCSTLRCPSRMVVPHARPASYIDPQTMPLTGRVMRPLSYSDSFYSPVSPDDSYSDTSVNSPQVFPHDLGPFTVSEPIQERSIANSIHEPISFIDETRTESFENLYQALEIQAREIMMEGISPEECQAACNPDVPPPLTPATSSPGAERNAEYCSRNEADCQPTLNGDRF